MIWVTVKRHSDPEHITGPFTNTNQVSFDSKDHNSCANSQDIAILWMTTPKCGFVLHKPQMCQAKL